MATRFKTALVWHRRDLRLSDNPALHHAAKEADQVIPVYVLSSWKKNHDWCGAPRQKFLCGCLESLAKNYESAGAKLIIRQGDAAKELEKLVRESGADALYFNRDVDPYGIAKENEVTEKVGSMGCKISSFKDVVLHEKNEILTGSDNPYKVYTPYSNNWMGQEKDTPLSRPKKLSTPSGIDSLKLPTLKTWGLSEPDADILEPGERAARDRLKNALGGVIGSYDDTRNTPDVSGGLTTSRISQDLRFGLLSCREVYAKAAAYHEDGRRSASQRKSAHVYLKEIAWRDFYMALLGHFPEVLEKEFKEDWRGLDWQEGSGENFERWQKGETGFPIVDAGMRELAATGFMHNRVRMIVSMFLTKDLRIHWMAGESHFMQKLVDGEIASNNGGWQWSAGTGADAAPYFRIQNPWTQTKSYDPEGKYIKQWVPELKDVAPKRLQEPPEDSPFGNGYPTPVVNHKAEREKTLAWFKKFRG